MNIELVVVGVEGVYLVVLGYFDIVDGDGRGYVVVGGESGEVVDFEDVGGGFEGEVGVREGYFVGNSCVIVFVFFGRVFYWDGVFEDCVVVVVMFVECVVCFYLVGWEGSCGGVF